MNPRAENASACHLFRGGRSFIIVRENPTVREILHELGHAHARRFIGPEYEALPEQVREHIAATFARRWWSAMSEAEQNQERAFILAPFQEPEVVTPLFDHWGVYR